MTPKAPHVWISPNPQRTPAGPLPGHDHEPQFRPPAHLGRAGTSGSTYVVTTLMLPPGIPLTVAMLRAARRPAAAVRQLPQGVWWPRVFLLGALNFSVFWAMLFVPPAAAAWRRRWAHPAAAGDRSLARLLLGAGAVAVLAAAADLGGVALLVLTPKAALDPVGVAAGLASGLDGAGHGAQSPLATAVSALTFTSWQLTAAASCWRRRLPWPSPRCPRSAC